MAKRRRLTPAQPGYLDAMAAPETKSAFAPGSTPAPIAQVAGDVSATAALAELSEAMQMAREDGRIIERLPLSAIDASYLVRDRIEQNDEEMGALMDSLRARGQQTAIEVTRLDGTADSGYSHGLISGWRRLTALSRLYSETRDRRFATIKALVIVPSGARDAYVSMVEENEIRVDLSHYERARIARKAVDEDVYPSVRAALQGLYASTTRSRRSKIGTFISVVDAFDDVLRYPTALTERLGLALAREIARNPGFVATTRAALARMTTPTAAEEQRILGAGLRPASGSETGSGQAPGPAPAPVTEPVSEPVAGHRAVEPPRITNLDGVKLSFQPGRRRIELSGDGVDEALYADMQIWMMTRQGDIS